MTPTRQPNGFLPMPADWASIQSACGGRRLCRRNPCGRCLPTGAANDGPGIALQLLLCPVTDLGLSSPSRHTFSEGYFFDIATLNWALGHCLTADAEISGPRLSPLRATDLRDLPPAHIHTAEFDPFLDDGKAYADALERARVPVACTCHLGMIHHFYCMAGAIPYARLAVKGIGESIKAALSCAPCALPYVGHDTSLV